MALSLWTKDKWKKFKMFFWVSIMKCSFFSSSSFLCYNPPRMRTHTQDRIDLVFFQRKCLEMRHLVSGGQLKTIETFLFVFMRKYSFGNIVHEWSPILMRMNADKFLIPATPSHLLTSLQWFTSHYFWVWIMKGSFFSSLSLLCYNPCARMPRACAHDRIDLVFFRGKVLRCGT